MVLEVGVIDSIICTSADFLARVLLKGLPDRLSRAITGGELDGL